MAIGAIKSAGGIVRLWNWFVTTLKMIAHNKVGLVGFIVVVAIVLMSYLSPIFWPFDTQPHPEIAFTLPSLSHPLGTDSAGRDMLNAIVNGGRDLITVAFEAAAIMVIVAVVLGTVSAYLGGWTDAAFTWLADIFLTVPQLPLLAVLAGLVRLDNLSVALVIGLLGWPTLMRAIRAQVLSLKERDYVEAARALDLGTWHILFREIAPTMSGYIAIHFMLATTSAMYASVGLTFLGLVPLSNNNWGVMLNQAWTRGAIFYSGGLPFILSPIVAIAIFQLSLVALTRSLSEVFDPRLRKGV